jgi:putative peptide zinc metalloprotease protein
MNQPVHLSTVIDKVIVDHSDSHPRYMVISHQQKYMQVSAYVYFILKETLAGRSFTSIAEQVPLSNEKQVTPEDIQVAYEYIINKIQKIDGERRRGQRDFWLKFPLFPTKIVGRVAPKLSFFFKPELACIILCCFFVAVTYSFTHGLLQGLILSNIKVFALAYVLFILSLFAHEFGHASACAHGGVPPSEIGFAIYLVFPVFYSDVSSSWQLGRWEKVRVDISGIYFQICVGLIYLALYLLTHFAVFQMAFFMVLGSCGLSLNPLLKFDGYWIITDVLNIVNLYKQPYRVFFYLYNCIRRRPQQHLPWSLHIAILIGVYGILRVVMWVGFLFALAPFALRTIGNDPKLLQDTIMSIHLDSFYGLLTNTQELVLNNALLVVWIIGLSRILLSTIPLFRRYLSNTLQKIRTLQTQ